MSGQDEIIRKIAQKDKGKQKKVEETIQLVIFELDNEEYAVEINDLQEIIRVPEITPVPNAPAFITGIFNLRGKIVVVVDLEKRFNLIREDDEQIKNVIIAEVENNYYGVLVDKVSEIKNIAKNTIQTTPVLLSSKIHSDYLKGVVVLKEADEEGKEEKDTENENSRLLILLDLPKLLQEKELLSLGQKVEEAISGEEVKNN